MNISKILSVFLILAIMTSISVVSLAKDQTNKSTETNIIDSTNDVPVAEIEEAKLPTPAEEKERLANRMKYAQKLENKSVPTISSISKERIVPPEQIATVPSDVAYSNPITGISIFGTVPGVTNIYSTAYSTWHSYSFYLPIASYVNINYNADIFNFWNWLAYSMYVDSDFLTSGDMAQTCGPCDVEIQMSRSTYLGKGWHTIYIGGLPGNMPVEEYYVANGRSLTITAFPEYTAITVTSPNGNENWYRGQTKSITWKKDGQPGANVKIELYKAGVLSSVISSITPNDGIYSWYIPSYTPVGTDYKIKISSTSETKYYDWSNNNFRIY